MQLGDRSAFSRLRAHAYLNHAAIAAPSDAACQRAAEASQDFAARGTAAFGTWAEQRERLRAKLAGLIGAGADDIAFVPNTSYGLGIIATSLTFREGERIILFDGEYPSNVSPFQQVARRLGLQVVLVPVADFAHPDGPDFRRLEAELAKGARLVAASAVQFQTGLRMPLVDIAQRVHAVGAELCVDGVQACGAVPVDVAEGIDYLACGSHKWLMGLPGAGFLYVNPTRCGSLAPSMVGCMSHVGALDMLFLGPGHLDYGRPLRPDARVFEGGMIDAGCYAALEAAIDPILALGSRAIFAHVSAYHDLLEPALIDRGFRSLRLSDPARQSCTLSLEPPVGSTAPQLVERLLTHGVAASCPDGVLRFSPHWPNAMSEVDVVLAAIDAG